MARIQSFAKDLQLATADIAPENLARELAIFAKKSLKEEIHEGRASPRYDRYVNGNLGADEFTVVPPGPILYEFHWWNEVIEFAIETLRKRSPVKSGRYRDSWLAMVNGAVVSDYSDIPVGAQVLVTNNQPYSRKIEVGFMEMSVPPHVVEDSLGTVRSRFGNVVDIKATMVTLPGGYILKGVFKKGIRKYSRTKLRRDTSAGAEMTYPSMLLTIRR